MNELTVSRDPSALIIDAHVWLAEQRADTDGIRNVIKGGAALDAMRQAAKRAGETFELELAYVEAARFADRRLGQLLLEGRSDGVVAGEGRRVTIDASIVTLGDLGLRANHAADAVIFADLNEQEWEFVIDGARAEAREDQDSTALSRAAIRRACNDVIAARSDDEWYTPGWLFDALGLRFDIDVCAPTDRTHCAVPAERFFTEADDGLAQDWDGLVWCNPPYSNPTPWGLRMIEHGEGLLLSHVPINGLWCLQVWRRCTVLCLLQGMEFVRPSGQIQRPAYWLQLAAFGPVAAEALERLEENIGEEVRDRFRPSPAFIPAWVTNR